MDSRRIGLKSNVMAAVRRLPPPRSPSSVAPARRRTRRIRGLDAEQRRAERREHLLAAALELFARDGYDNTSIEQICQTAYVGNKAFYELFDSKEDCYVGLLRQITERIERRLAQALQQSIEQKDKDTLREVLSVFAHAVVDDPRVAVVSFGERAGISPRVEAQRRENRRWAAAFIEAFWRENLVAEDNTRAAVMDYHALAVATVGGLFDTIADWIYDANSPQPRTIDKLIADLTTFASVIEAGIAARTGTS